jgi:branched-chain amino acid transport system permease protein
VFAWAFIRTTRYGRYLRAVANNAELAEMAGLNVELTTLLAVGLGSGLAGLVAILNALDTGLVPTMGFQALVSGMVACIIGGIRSIVEVATGGLILGLTMYFGVWKIPTQWQDGIVFVVLILFLLFRPFGVAGKASAH